MSYKSLLVQLDASEAAEERLDLALRLTKQFGAHLTAIFTVYRPGPASFYAMAAAAQYLAERDQWVEERRTGFARHFSADTARLDVPGEWLSTQAYANQEVPRLSRLADLTIAGQPDPDDPDSLVADQFPENLVLSSGRPVLFVPYTGTFPTVGTRVLVAWDGSREAARALRDALPFLASAERTTVVTINALEKENEPPASRLPGADIAAVLARHGAHVATDQIEGVHGMAIGDTLLSRAADLSADLIVMGAYGHSRWRELMLGGATRSMLKTMTMPVLMSH